MITLITMTAIGGAAWCVCRIGQAAFDRAEGRIPRK